MTDHVTRIEKVVGASYTFQLETNGAGVKFYNLVVDVDNNGNMTKSHIIEYLPSAEWLLDKTQPFSGEARVINNDIFTQEDILSFQGKGVSTARGGLCWRVEIEWECNAGNDHAPDTCTAGGSTLIINLRPASCGSGGGSSGSFSVSAPSHAGYDPTNTGGSGSGGSSGGGNDGGTITTIPDPLNQDGSGTAGEAQTDNIVFPGFANHRCQQIVISEAMGICSPLTQLVLDIFEANDGVNLIVTTAQLDGNNAVTSGLSNYNATTHTCDITITFDESYLETATDLSIARTAIHESLHAVFAFMREEGLLQNPDGSALDGFQELLDAYIAHLSGKPANVGKAHHDLMADFVDDMAVSLMAYGKAQGYRLPRSYYTGLCWSGAIKNSPSFQTLYPEYIDPNDAVNNPANRNPEWIKIVMSIEAEQNNTTTQYPHPNGTIYEFVPKGTAPNTGEPCN
ncbi:hypothetical protein Q4Q34_10635 [Flavivirga abyssicola]|uniref:hypothetical protein n=1 Tax=Flavivirga abyssicola TaxID=3063533 RepID=UPI0026E0B29C|nr:hypothetical protein [Flavivirga sp. MEBiC07777]WVK11681.1 hypothetical protein Q4Q34_10635 [Flavivirga sp. MEBiC07777]